MSVTYDKVREMDFGIWRAGGRPDVLVVHPSGMAELMASYPKDAFFFPIPIDGGWYLPLPMSEVRIIVDSTLSPNASYLMSDEDYVRLKATLI